MVIENDLDIPGWVNLILFPSIEKLPSLLFPNFSSSPRFAKELLGKESATDETAIDLNADLLFIQLYISLKVRGMLHFRVVYIQCYNKTKIN